MNCAFTLLKQKTPAFVKFNLPMIEKWDSTMASFCAQSVFQYRVHGALIWPGIILGTELSFNPLNSCAVFPL